MPKSKKKDARLQKKKITKKKTRRQIMRKRRQSKILYGGIEPEIDLSTNGKFSNIKREVAIRDFPVNEKKNVKSIEDIAFELTVDKEAISMTKVIGSDSKQYLRIYCETRQEPFLILSNLSNAAFTPYEDAPDTGPYSNNP